MKTFLVLFIIAASLPAEAQRVKENIRQKVEIVDDDPAEIQNKENRKADRERQKERKEKRANALRQE